MIVNLLAFGIAKDIIHNTEIDLEVMNPTVLDLRNKLEEDYPKLKSLASYMLAINNEYAQNDMPLHITDEIALIPPVSGG